MAVTRTIHLKVGAFDPKTNSIVGIGNAQVRLEDKGPLKASVTTSQPVEADVDGKLSMELSYADGGDGNVKPLIKVEIPENRRQILSEAGDTVHLPGDWNTGHEKRGDTVQTAEHTTEATALQVVVGLPTKLQLSYADFHRSGYRNPMALPEHTLNIHMADEDWTGCWSWLNPEDKIKGKGAKRDLSANQDIGVQPRYPYYDFWPTAPRHETSVTFAPNAWLDPPGAPVATLGTASFAAVGPMAVDREGFVFTIDGDKVHRFYPDGTLAQTLNGLAGAGGLAVDRQRRLYVTLEAAGSVRIFSLNTRAGILNRGGGGYQLTATLINWGLDPIRDTLIKPRGISVIQKADSSQVLAVTALGQADGQGKGVHLFDIRIVGTPRHLHSFALQATASNIFGIPEDVAGDRTGRLFVADSGKQRIWRYELNNLPAAPTFWGKADGTTGINAGEFSQPMGLAMDEKNGHLYVVNRGNHRVLRVSAGSGNFVRTWQPFNDPFFLAVDPRGDLYIARNAAAAGDRRIHRYTIYNRASGNALAAGADPVAFGNVWTPIAHKDHLNQPEYVYFDRQKRLWVCDTANDWVLAYTRDADRRLRPDPDLRVIDGLDKPAGVTADEAGNLYISEPAQKRVRRFDANTLMPTATVLNNTVVRGLATLKRGVQEFLVCADPDTDTVHVVKLDGTAEATLVPSAAGAFSDPWDVAVDGAGAVYVVERTGSRLLKLAAGAAWATAMTHVNFNIALVTGNPLQEPRGVWCGEDNHVFITDHGNHTIFQLDSGGNPLAWWNLENLIRQRLNTPQIAPAAGTVTLVPTNQRRQIRDHLGNDAWVITGTTTLNFTPTGGGATVPTVLPVDSVLLVNHNDTVATDDVMAATSGQWIFEPELVDNLVLWSPCKAVLDDGLLVVAERQGSRLRLLRIHTNLRANLLDLDERFPDLLTYTQAQADWRDELGLHLKVSDRRPNTDVVLTHKVGPRENFSGERICQRVVYDYNTRLNEAVNTMEVIRQVQRWMSRLTRMDQENFRWQQVADDFVADITVDASVSHFAHRDAVFLATDTTGRGADTWDNSVIAHEVTHWIFSKSIIPAYRVQMMTHYPGGNHSASMISNQVMAIVEGFAEYHECFWGSEFGAADRLRGFRLDRLRNLSNGSSPFATPNSNLEVEGYYAMTMYQLHQMTVHPGAIFADNPDYWYRYNYDPSDADSTAFSTMFRRALRLYPLEPSTAQAQTPVSQHLHNLRDRFIGHAGAVFVPPLSRHLRTQQYVDARDRHQTGGRRRARRHPRAQDHLARFGDRGEGSLRRRPGWLPTEFSAHRTGRDQRGAQLFRYGCRISAGPPTGRLGPATHRVRRCYPTAFYRAQRGGGHDMETGGILPKQFLHGYRLRFTRSRR